MKEAWEMYLTKNCGIDGASVYEKKNLLRIIIFIFLEMETGNRSYNSCFLSKLDAYSYELVASSCKPVNYFCQTGK